ncbi:hypothetical protein [Saccharomonospora piscinae]|uniref:Uncharacterized protein n=1 Tax=Saccharomonospora piscinae TaxID=687388 RepID=A0A1V9A1P6_SACPI|nr:hypothetical protein [Saccharomonospora piscinae]OQO90963.1 hypothetical protein B1813_15775 [Saccharomonospora piscinae]
MTESGEPDGTPERRESDEQRRAKGLPPEPSMPGAARDRGRPPTPVSVSFWLYVLAGLVLVAAFGFTLTQQEDVSEALIDLNTTDGLDEEQIRSGVTTLLWTLFVGAVAFAVMFALFGWKAREGTRSARTTLTVLAVITLLLQVLLFPTSLPMLAASFLAVVATALLYLPSVAHYFPRATGGGSRR